MFNGWLITGSSRGLGRALIEVVLDHALLNL
jgi:NAD(P)-dependent dehydrogenase (short-subunit alcohol dehydrogenase family)